MYVCLSQDYTKTAECISTPHGGRTPYGAGKNPSQFWADPGIFVTLSLTLQDFSTLVKLLFFLDWTWRFIFDLWLNILYFSCISWSSPSSGVSSALTLSILPPLVYPNRTEALSSHSVQVSLYSCYVICIFSHQPSKDKVYVGISIEVVSLQKVKKEPHLSCSVAKHPSQGWLHENPQTLTTRLIISASHYEIPSSTTTKLMD